MKELTPDQQKALFYLKLERKIDSAIIPELIALGLAAGDPLRITPLGWELLRFSSRKNLKPENIQ
ncbi:hypothetical protein FHT87_004612 [Rhizobium sp. BK316]|uniref:hypothetical protein n=1 Tax=Rhizobium sp. BK316 TaxID=2587053 RepID=UPI00160D093B|nr:hypothetical protein [Rhizobium sp. BK316]MBB3410680.1 hypothetical protein [Rhizobium sp. BK316]